MVHPLCVSSAFMAMVVMTLSFPAHSGAQDMDRARFVVAGNVFVAASST